MEGCRSVLETGEPGRFEVSHPAAGGLDNQYYGTAALVETIRLDAAAELGEVRLHVDVAGCPTLAFAPKSLRSIVYNLLSNAAKYRHPDRPAEVQLRCRTSAGAVVLEVADNGLGLSERQQSQLFRMFRRLHDHVPGSGIGLYMVKRIVENVGGTVTVHSAPGVGSTFTLSPPTPAPGNKSAAGL